MRRYITHYRKNQVKALLLFSIMTLTIFIGVSFLTTSTNSPVTEQTKPNSAASLDVPWSGTGDPESARAFIQKSDSATSQTDEFDITVPTSPSVLYSADMNFTILSGFETTYEFEQDTALEYPKSQHSSRDNPNWSEIESSSTDSYYRVSGTENGLSDGYEGLVDTSLGTALILEDNTVSPADNVVTFSYTANFTRSNFERLETIGFRILVDRIITRDVSANIYVYNHDTLNWDLKYTENWDNAQTVEEITIANTQITYLNSTNEFEFRLELVDQDSFTVTYRDLKVEALIAEQSPISTLDYTAMEFDILGDVSASGFFAWVRTLTTSPTANLNVSLYEANQTAKRIDVTSATKINLEPNFSSLLSTNIITNFDTDEYVFIPFKSDYSDVELSVGNYFVVLSSDTADTYSIATLPYDGSSANNDPDGIRDHLFLHTENGGVTWEKVFAGGGQVDAAPFAINLTRPYLPEEIDMKVDGMEIKSYTNRKGIYENTSGYLWGLGNWDNEFDSTFEDTANTITVPIEFNTSIISSLDFNVTYSAVAYARETTTTNYHVELDALPSWEVNYTLTQASYTGWNYINSSFTLPVDWLVEEILDTNYNSLMEDLEVTIGDDRIDYWITELTDGVYSVNATSPNYVYEMNTFLQYEEEFWETNGFMRGDNISVSLNVLNYSSPTSEIFSGMSEINVYNPEDTLLGGLTMIDVNPDETEAVIADNDNLLLTQYEFDSENILNTTGSTPQGEYSFVFKWSYGNEVGYKRLPVLIMEYGVEITDIRENYESQVDEIISTISTNLTTAESYNSSLFAIEDITGASTSDEYHVNESIGHIYTDFNVNVSQVAVNESLFNPGETMNVTINLENYNLYWANDVTVNAQFIQSTNYKWLVMEQTGSVELGMLGSGSENSSVELQFTIPSDFKGINGPIRLNPFVLKLEININGTDLDPLYLDTLFPFVEKTESEFEGRVWTESLVHNRPGPLSKVLPTQIDRIEELVHSEVTYLMQISDSFFVTCNVSEYDKFTTKPIAQFNSVNIVELVWGNDFQLQGTLTDEFGAYIDNQEIIVEVNNGTEWIVYNQTTENPLQTNNEGFFNGSFDSTIVEKSNLLELRLSWGGNTTIYGVTTEFEFDMLTYDNLISIEIVNATDLTILKEKQENTIVFQITNIGNSTLRNIEIHPEFLGISEDNIRIGDLAYSLDKQLEPDETLYIECYVTIQGSYQDDTGVITVSVTCESYESGEFVEFESEFELTVLTSSFLDNLDAFIKTMFFIGLAALVLGAIYYVVKIRRKLQETTQVEQETRPRRGRYVEVAKLQKQPEKAEEEIEEGAEEKTADLDDLLKEEGLED